MKVGPHLRWSEDFVGRMVIHMLANVATKEQQDAFYAVRSARSDKAIEVRLLIDDIDLDFRPFVENVEKELDRMIVERAGELLREKLSIPLSEMEEAVEELVSGVKRKAAELLGYDPWRNR